MIPEEKEVKRDKTFGRTKNELGELITRENRFARKLQGRGRDDVASVSHQVLNEYLDAYKEVTEDKT